MDDVASISQREAGTDTGGFSEALRNAMRQDPAVIMVGEMRDPETVSTVITAAETGHLVFSTLHTNNATQTVDRILDTFPPDHLWGDDDVAESSFVDRHIHNLRLKLQRHSHRNRYIVTVAWRGYQFLPE